MGIVSICTFDLLLSRAPLLLLLPILRSMMSLPKPLGLLFRLGVRRRLSKPIRRFVTGCFCGCFGHIACARKQLLRGYLCAYRTNEPDVERLACEPMTFRGRNPSSEANADPLPIERSDVSISCALPVFPLSGEFPAHSVFHETPFCSSRMHPHSPPLRPSYRLFPLPPSAENSGASLRTVLSRRRPRAERPPPSSGFAGRSDHSNRSNVS